MIRLQTQGLSKTYHRSKEAAVKKVDLQLEEGQLLALVGESGSGKTTLLRLIAGLEQPDEGTIWMDGVQVASPEKSLPADKRGVGLVFQHHALFPHLNVEQNIGFGISHLGREKRQETVHSLLELVGLSHFNQRYPHELSGGERQRIALARALAPNPKLLLLDEPFSSLDALLRQSVRDDTRAILKKRGATAILVTHDTMDALSIADRIAVLKDSEVQQNAPPLEIYREPANDYVAALFGACNFLSCSSLFYVQPAWQEHRIGPPVQGRQNRPGFWIRPEDLELGPPDKGLIGTVQKVSFQGGYLEVQVCCQTSNGEAVSLRVWQPAPYSVEPGQRVAVIPRRKGRSS